MFIREWVSLDRVNDFLEDTELSDEFGNVERIVLNDALQPGRDRVSDRQLHLVE